MKLEREIRHKSEDIEDEVLLDVVRAIRRRVRVLSREYDIPYIAGYSEDGRTVFIDRHLPKSFRWLTKVVRVDPFLLTHEIVEKALLDELRLHYLHAHQIALRSERDAVKAAGGLVVGLSALHAKTRKTHRGRKASPRAGQSRSHTIQG
jgi:hypothetical protein